MLMEHSAETSHDTENAKKSRSLDVQGLYKTKPWGSARKKGGSQSQSSTSNAVKRKRSSEDQNGVRKKSKKEVLLSSLASGGRSKKSAGEVYRGRTSSVSSEPGNSELRVDQRDNVGGGGLGGFSLKLDTSVNIPKRPRDLVRRRKVEVDVGSKQEVSLSSKATLGEGGQLNGNSNGHLLHNGSANENGKLSENGNSEGASTGNALEKVKKENKSYDHKENRSSGSDFQRRLKREDSRSSVNNGKPLTKKARRNHKKTKKAGAASPVVTKDSKQVLDESSRVCDDSQDDEENLEANAARMLSSRFDPSCTGFSSGGKCSKLPSTNGLSALISSSREFVAEPDTRDESDIASSDDETRVLRPRDQQKGKGISRKRRHFYEVLFRELDSYWVLNRRIKVFWPLDQSWYYGHVIDYDAEKKHHHIKYDDREEEWVDLQNERFKLLLLPSEVPGKVGRKKSRMLDNHTRAGNRLEAKDTEGYSNSYMESEPIISWLARSSRKSPSSGIRKKQKTLNDSAKSLSSSFSGGKLDPRGSFEVGSSGGNADDLVCSSVLPENSGDSTRHGKSLTENFISHNNRPPIVYFRRRFHRREQPAGDIHSEALCSGKDPVCGTVPEYLDTLSLDDDMLQSMDRCDNPTKSLSPDEFIWNIDDSGHLKLSISVTSLKVFRVALSFPLPVFVNKLFGWQSSIFMLQHGTLISVWPMIHLEMLFVDNVVGLRFLLFEGCLKQAVFFLFLVMGVFSQSNQKEKHFDRQLPVTSVRFRLSGLQDFQKQLVFTFYNFIEVANSKWSYLDRKLKRHCLLTKQLPPSECTYDNIKALRNGCNPLPSTSVSGQRSSMIFSSNQRSWKRPRQHKMNNASRQSAYLKLSRLSWCSDEKQGKLPPFALSFAAAPTFFLSLHLKLLMERSIPSSSFGEQDPVSLMDHSDNDSGLVGVDVKLVQDRPIRSSLYVGSDLGVLQGSRSESEACSNLCNDMSASSADPADRTRTKPSQFSLENEVGLQLEEEKAPLTRLEPGVLSGQTVVANGQHSPVMASVGPGPLSGLTIEVPSCGPIEKDADGGVGESHHPVNLAMDVSDGDVRSPNLTTPRSIWHQNRVGSSRSPASANMSPAWSDGKQDFLRNGFGHGPKKPRTHVSYSLPLGGHENNSKNKFHHGRGFSHKRIRRASEKKTSEALGTSERNMESLSCDANVLVTAGDRGWRECGVRVVLELFDHSEWRLAVKISGDTKYSYKAHQFLQPGTTNRYTHAMMWKGGKDWILEFPDRSQWTSFKEMHEECFNRNLRAASVKNIPIPGVHLVEENDDNVPEVPFVRPSPKYYRQVETDIDIGMDPSRILYDMDSDDERWLAKCRGLDSNKCGCGDISDEMFEKAMDVFEKVAYAKQCDHFSSEELEEDMAGLGPLETIKIIYEHWREKRQQKGMPLIRHLQPPLWEKYQQQVKEWEQAVIKCNVALSNGCQEKPTTIEKPSMFAFCMKPRGLELPNRGSKQRSQKKLPVGALSNGIPVDSDAFHSLASRRFNGCALGDERAVYNAYNQGMSDSSPVLQGSTRVISPRDAVGMGYFQLSSDVSERNHYPKLYKNKSKKLCFIPPSDDHQAFASYNQRMMGKRTAVHEWNMSSSEWPSQMHYLPDRFQKHSFEQLDPSELNEFRLRDAASVARHAVTMAKMKRENAQRMLCRADLAMHKAVAAIMTSEAINASHKEPNGDGQMTG